VPSIDVQGHRGARGLFPENTLPAFAHAIDIGVTTLELDCGITKDGVVVVSHGRALSPDIARDEHGAWLSASPPPISSLTFDELRRYDVGRIRPGSAYAERLPGQQPVDGSRVPRLAEVFALVRDSGRADVRLNIETKTSPLAPRETVAPETFARILLAEIERAAMMERVSIQSFDWRTLASVQSAASVPTVYLTAERTSPNNILRQANSSPWTAGLHVSAFEGSVPRMIAAAGGAAWSPYHGDLTLAALREAHALGHGVIPWTVNREPDMRRLIRWGADAMISDYPDLLLRIAREDAAARE
jgi:glycerophosphoryl diester phosphodiesterase